MGFWLGLLLLMVDAPAPIAAGLEVRFPLQRDAYQDNEPIVIAVVRQAGTELAAGELRLLLAVEGDGPMGFRFPAGSVAVRQGEARDVIHLQVNGRFLRPGSYHLQVECDGGIAGTNFSVHSAIRRSSFKLINWGRARGKDRLGQGEDNLGFNVFYGDSSRDDEQNLLRAGVDFIACCTMSGGHQMDLRTECDWSDPYVIRGGTRRVAQRAFIDRTRPNVLGIHFYDEPGLTVVKDPATGQVTPHAVPWQWRSYAAAFGEPPLSYRQVDPRQPDQVARWDHWARWKLGLMDAAWRDAQWGVSSVRPDFVSLTQSQYGWTAFTDGYYYTVVRSLPIISGHGGYHDFGPGYFNPSLFLEFARANDRSKPNWYLPTWYSSTTSDEFRLEQYLSFQCNLQGMISPPDLEPADPAKSKAAQGIVESNHLLARLGPVFTTLPVTRPPVALLYSLSQLIHAQVLDRTKNYAHDLPHGRGLPFVYLAGKLLQHQFMPVLDEEVLDGTVAGQHRAILLTSIDYLDPRVVDALAAFSRQRGLVLLTRDCTVRVPGAVILDAQPEFPDAARIAELRKAGKDPEAGALMKLRHYLAGAQKLAAAILPHLEAAGLRPPLTSSEPGITVTRQAAGDVEYLLAVNATHDPAGDPLLGIRSVTATLGLEGEDRPVYDAVQGGRVDSLGWGAGRWTREFRFGPGQMRVLARTTRPIGGVKAATPVFSRDVGRALHPLRLDLGAVVLDDRHGIVSGSIPLRIRVLDPLGGVRYDLYRATEGGSLRFSLPLAWNDPPGPWQVHITELLGLTEDRASFVLPRISNATIVAGLTPRAIYFNEDRDHVFQFFRTHQEVTVVAGTNDFLPAAVERLQAVLAPWNVRVRAKTLTEANRSRPISEEEAATWIGLDYAGRGQIKPGSDNEPKQVGFAVTGPVILLGNPEDNPLIRFLAERQFLPYPPNRVSLPGPRRGYLAWQRDGLGVGQESITLIAYDADGLSEAVGTLYELMAGTEPLTLIPSPWPDGPQLISASKRDSLPEFRIEGSVVLADRVVGLQVDGPRIRALTQAGTLTELQLGQTVSQQILSDDEVRRQAEAWGSLGPDTALTAIAQAKASPGQWVKLVRERGERVAVAYWGGTVKLCDRSGTPLAVFRSPQDITALAWDGPRLIVGDADGRVTTLRFED